MSSVRGFLRAAVGVGGGGAEMFDRGWRQVDVMVELEVSAQTASRWHRDWLAGGREALAGAGRAGRLPRLSDDQLAAVETKLAEGPKAHGFPTDLWTLARVAEVIERVTGVRYSTTQTWTILRERTLDEAHIAAQAGLERVGSSYQLCFSFLDHTGLRL
ncbi:helix-turn-helix domain-containing protein [Saccharothrix sp. ALI-22-I]|uniref:helix-turn-helix domain-containing protein n=1 Tax=Saccharothrix sp. ALI-22-I TaxID=1933778 RepID=UPI0009FCE4BC|nr:helix-turn-helix domain-containing protein [Saccharothrix sp. ALI-22-I]